MKGGGLLPLAIGTVALSPIALASWLEAKWQRRAFKRNIRSTLAALGIRGQTITVEVMGQGASNAVYLVTVDGRRIVLKHTLRFGTVLAWAAREFGAMCEYPDHLGRDDRFAREVDALRELEAAGLPVARCIAASSDNRVMALEWIDGPALASEIGRKPQLAADLGRLLARVHARGFAMGDPNPRNVAVTPDGALVPFDLEVSQADATDAQKGFDLAWASAFLPDAAKREFFDAYGLRSPSLDDALDAARTHLERFWPLIDLYAWQWRRAA